VAAAAAAAVVPACRGKLLNVRDATALQISENVEIQNIKQILGLQHGKAYEDVKALRYGHLMIMTDQVRQWGLGAVLFAFIAMYACAFGAMGQ
jgi:DNA gyrase/topoisomerase IV subunit B